MHKIQCKKCGSSKCTKRGFRNVKNTGFRQIYQCKECGIRFTENTHAGYSYPARALLSAPILFAEGFNLSEVHRRISNRFRIAPSLSTVRSWVLRFGKLNANKDKKAKPEPQKKDRPISRRMFDHGQRYLLQVHEQKKSQANQQHPGLCYYLDDLLSLRQHPDHTTLRLRASTLKLGIGKPTAASRPCYATLLAKGFIPLAADNHGRHAALQRAFIAFDKATIATEVPVYLTPNESTRILRLSGGLLGHIDFLQVFGNTIMLLDYKPNSQKERRAHEQLLVYAIALSVRTGIHLSAIRCAWFDEKDYFQFSALSVYHIFRARIAGPHDKISMSNEPVPEESLNVR